MVKWKLHRGQTQQHYTVLLGELQLFANICTDTMLIQGMSSDMAA